MASWELTWAFLRGFLGTSWGFPRGFLGASWGLHGGYLEASWAFLGGFPGTFNCDIIDGLYCKMYMRGGKLNKGRVWYQSKPSKVNDFTLTGPTFGVQMVGSKWPLLAHLVPWVLRHNTKGRSLASLGCL